MTSTSTAHQPWSSVVPTRSRWRPVGFDHVVIRGGHWGAMQALNASAILPHCHSWMEKVGWIDNLRRAQADDLASTRQGREFTDSDVYKLLEAMAWEMAREPSADLRAAFDEIVAVVSEAQEADGYINTKFGRSGQQSRYSDLAWGHELYNYGHLLQAAVAFGRTGGTGPLLEVARRVADHICNTFGPDGVDGVCGHPEVEVALVEYARFTGDDRYRDQAKLFLERRGHGRLPEIEFGRSYFQDEIPLRNADRLDGHAVRATYLAAAAVDVASDLEDVELLGAVVSQVKATVARRTYITGGMGAHHEGESFGADFELPSERAYSETCAGVGAAMVFQRLLLETGESDFADHLERVLYNVICTSPSQDGRSFFYTNTLHRRTLSKPVPDDHASPRAASGMRAPWFAVSCCPTNVSRVISQLGSMVAMHDGRTLRIGQIIDGVVQAELDGGFATVRLVTDYPRTGAISVVVDEVPEGEWLLELRIPAWSRTLRLIDEEYPEGRKVSRPGSGWLALDPALRGGRVTVVLDMHPRITRPDPRIDAIRGQVAVERGPLVYCAESTEGETDLERVRVVGQPRQHGEQVSIPITMMDIDEREWPFQSDRDDTPQEGASELPLIPYWQWGNRGPSTMRVWLPE